ncbi:hypothetical protein HAX54_000190 [Datura stramonium]|uniref:Uncharacterized protein n=1 Tax=Datura stramonium TaxID=4076 RepID=A0ABS8WSM2_DATST|nr:hypothetical protein [Datura stramonium]
MENKVDNTNDEKDEEHHGTEGISNYTRFNSLVDLCEVLQDEISDHHNIRKDQKDSVEKKSSNQQQEEDVNGIILGGQISLSKLLKLISLGRLAVEKDLYISIHIKLDNLLCRLEEKALYPSGPAELFEGGS